ncbi:bacteriohemerythrin [Carboxylicivirga sp. RSCT41]|uniref:bacteriohemerythrin n=1 Tax=Carboxylicivirga agarovorans TaxID=3417570 RepID=UPI003D3514E9
MIPNSSTLSWKAKYQIDVARIDLEHKLFLRLINSFKMAINKGRSDETLRRIIDEIEKYASFHFASEENLMVAINYPEYEEHSWRHKDLLETLKQKKQSISGFDSFHQFLVEWFIEHTTVEDIRIKHFVDDYNIDVKEFCYDIQEDTL